VAAGHLRMSQFLHALLDEHDAGFQGDSKLYLRKAKRSLVHALSLGEIEAETKIEAQVALANVMLLLAKLADAQQLITQTLQEAQELEFTWLIARSQHVLACILAAQAVPEQATPHFDAALKTFRKTGMRLELARTLQHYGAMLMQQGNTDEKQHQRGRKYLEEARELFAACGANLDLQLIERVVASEAIV
jgi:Tfp pilus assembly protein PilF